jgi:hypothetical protein
MIPAFDKDGLLPPGIHNAEWDEFYGRYGTTIHRKFLLEGLKRALYALREARCHTVYIDGSFVTAKEVPVDFDACWSWDGVDLDLLDPVLTTFDNGRAAQKAKYYGELFPAEANADAAGKVFLEFFQIDMETGKAKGIVKLDLRRLP